MCKWERLCKLPQKSKVRRYLAGPVWRPYKHVKTDHEPTGIRVLVIQCCPGRAGLKHVLYAYQVASTRTYDHHYLPREQGPMYSWYDCSVLNSYLWQLFSVYGTTPDKYGSPIIDFSKDKEAQADLDAQTQIAKCVIVKVFARYAIPLELTNRIRAAFMTKLWRMGRTLPK